MHFPFLSLTFFEIEKPLSETQLVTFSDFHSGNLFKRRIQTGIISFSSFLWQICLNLHNCLCAWPDLVLMYNSRFAPLSIVCPAYWPCGAQYVKPWGTRLHTVGGSSHKTNNLKYFSAEKYSWEIVWEILLQQLRSTESMRYIDAAHWNKTNNPKYFRLWKLKTL